MLPSREESKNKNIGSNKTCVTVKHWYIGTCSILWKLLFYSNIIMSSIGFVIVKEHPHLQKNVTGFFIFKNFYFKLLLISKKH